jgi:hypothetical protein
MRGMKCAVHEDVKDLVEKPDANRLLGRSKCTRENNIENDPKEMGRESVCLNRCGVVLNTAMKLRFSQYEGGFWDWLRIC